MAASAALTYDQVSLMVKNGYTGDATMWDKAYEYILLHLNDLFLIPENRRWSICHQIVFHGNLKLLKKLLSLYNEENPINIRTPTKDSPKPLTILDIANDRKSYYKEQYTYIEHLFAQDRFIQACKTFNWAVIDEMLHKEPTLINEKPPYCSNYYLHHLVFYGDVRKFCQYNSPENPFRLDLQNADGKTALDLAREAKNESFVEELETLITGPVRQILPESRDERGDDRDLLSGSASSTNAQYTIAQPSALSPAIRKNITCPLTRQIFVDPVIGSDGQTYERQAIIEYLRENRLSPSTGVLMDGTFTDNNEIKNIIRNFRQQKLLP